MSISKLQINLIPFVTVCLILGVSVVVIAFGRGYRFDFQKTLVKPTGIISATSDPIGAQVFIDGKFKTGTNNSFTIDPNWYTIRISKDGYSSWEKRIRVQGEVVARADAFLFPSNPSLSPLTTTGIVSPVLSPDGSRIAYIVPTPSKSTEIDQKKLGLRVLELADRPLGRNRDPQQIGITSDIFDFNSNTLLTWSPDSTEIMVTTGSLVRIYPVRGGSTSFRDISLTLQSVVKDWADQQETKDRQKLAGLPQPIIDMATSSAKIISYSPDETKIFYEATASATIPKIIDPSLIGTNPTEEQRAITPGKLYIYDSKEDKNFFLFDKKELAQPTPTPAAKQNKASSTSSLITHNAQPTTLSWFPTNKHIILSQNGKIDIMEYDRTNWITIYSGPFVQGFLAPWPNNSRIVILTNLNPGASTLPNLYTINLR